ncbi:glycosyltransferase [Clostridium tyrobutyricum]|uniref:glycosyltransferase n=1 Tax=Clostridium tyrobutyricum TaxID=1519 RepID=UPI001C387862|nr:glycosyltransferase [Clostridium tyrobutyricum]MBV4430078.1 glycosyltransferase [Clostridium tyrobutyricum]
MFTEKDAEALFIITDDTGMIQHSSFTIPDPNSGYTTDDNARALMTSVMLYEKYSTPKYLKLIYRYLSFLLYAQNKNGGFKNFMDYNRNFIEENGSEDCFGRCLWCLGYTLNSNSLSDTVKYAVLDMIKKAIPNIYNLNFIKGKSYSLIGLCLIFNFMNDKDKIKDTIVKISDQLVNNFKINSNADWKWFEDKLTYSNSILPFSLLKSYALTKNQEYLNIAIDTLSFLDNIYFKSGYFKPIGCNGWFEKGDISPAEFDEQPVESCSSAFMYLEAYKITRKSIYLNRLKSCYEWFTGNNSSKKSLIDKSTHGSYDGIMKSRINLNTGAESILAKITTQLLLSEYL